ncbi:hypothetical protein BCT06_13655 [Vibrio breoganii]|uniref:acyltransferase n=1 Tax=Vibrio breoganii TaxID=553239 RepID=UPI000C81970E|nr:acyltransferase family protein [Vibrio breoganii]PMO59951.1 hypothetical protein BCT06_13655 [Vibrio breoganii]
MINEENKNELNWITELRLICSIAVVCVHASMIYVSGIESNNELYGSVNWWMGNIFDGGFRWAVPVFVIISGYLLLDKDENNLVFFSKRIKKLLAPIIFWSIFYSFWWLTFDSSGPLSGNIIELAKRWVLGSPYYHFWYLYMIVLIYLSTPLIRIIFKYTTKKELKVILVIIFSITIINNTFGTVFAAYYEFPKVDLVTNTFLSFICYYVFGGYVKKYDLNITNRIAIIAFIISLILTLTGSYMFGYKYFYFYLSANVVIASLSIFLIYKNFKKTGIRKKILVMRDYSFGIYLLHPLLLSVLDSMFYFELAFIDITIKSLGSIISCIYIIKIFGMNKFTKRLV